MPTHPPCGVYKTTRAFGDVPAGRLVNFHNHGDPGPGIYLPKSWRLNEAEWQERGITTPDAEWTSTLQPLPAQGLCMVTRAFACCEKQCVTFREGQLVQLGYDGEANPIVFTPEWTVRGLGFPERGTRVDLERLSALKLLSVARGADAPPSGLLH